MQLNMKSTAITLADKELFISGQKVGLASPHWANGSLRPHFIIELEDSKGTCQAFDYYGSIGMVEITETDLLNALDCILRDAIAGSESFNNFCSEFGYNNDSIAAKMVWHSCIRTLQQMLTLAELNELRVMNCELLELQNNL